MLSAYLQSARSQCAVTARSPGFEATPIHMETPPPPNRRASSGINVDRKLRTNHEEFDNLKRHWQTLARKRSQGISEIRKRTVAERYVLTCAVGDMTFLDRRSRIFHFYHQRRSKWSSLLRFQNRRRFLPSQVLQITLCCLDRSESCEPFACSNSSLSDGNQFHSVDIEQADISRIREFRQGVNETDRGIRMPME
jgi:hypothetical protein